ncbi:glycosyltransferase, partial [Sphingomonas prati]
MDGSAFWLMSGARHELGVFAQFGFLAFGLEQLFFDTIWIDRAGWRAATIYTRHDRVTMETLAAPVAPGRFAILIGAWDEAAVIGSTLSTALSRWGDADYRIYVATYPNDPATHAAIEAVRTTADARRRIRIVPGDRPGPVTKAEALNRNWDALRADEAAEGFRYKAAILHDAEDYELCGAPYNTYYPDSIIIPLSCGLRSSTAVCGVKHNHITMETDRPTDCQQ